MIFRVMRRRFKIFEFGVILKDSVHEHEDKPISFDLASVDHNPSVLLYIHLKIDHKYEMEMKRSMISRVHHLTVCYEKHPLNVTTPHDFLPGTTEP